LSERPATRDSLLGRAIGFCIENKLIVALVVLLAAGYGVLVAPFNWDVAGLERDPLPVDAIPDYGENQQIVFTEWMGRSPQDVQDQITYPLTVSLLGIPQVKTIRSYSYFGFSSIYVIFEDGADFYWSRSRLLEKLSSLPAGTMPAGTSPVLGPDATALGQVFWYTLEGRDADGNPAGGWDLDELRSIQDWQVRYALMSAKGVSEVASIGGFVREYQVDVDPDAMRAHRVTLEQVFNAVRQSNVDVGARTIEINRVEYIIRGLGFLESLEDLEISVVASRDGVPIHVKDVAHVSLGPALRRGALDKAGAEAVGGVVVVRYGENPLAAIEAVKARIDEISGGLPKKTLEDGRESRVTIIPFYDRTGLIHETLGTLETALVEEILVTILVVIVMVLHLRSSLLVAGLLPLAVLLCFAAMKIAGVDANIVSLSGIAIAIGTMVDMGIVVTENIFRRLSEASPEDDRLDVVRGATREVGGAVVTAIATTIVSFIPVFTMAGAAGKLFRPLAFTKTFALLASVLIALFVLPAAAHLLLGRRAPRNWFRVVFNGLLAGGGVVLLILGLTGDSRLFLWSGILVLAAAAHRIASPRLPAWARGISAAFVPILAALLVATLLADHWSPLGPARGQLKNVIFVVGVTGGLLLFFRLFQVVYPTVLRWCLAHKLLFLTLPAGVLLFGLFVWQGFGDVMGFVPEDSGVRSGDMWRSADEALPGLGSEFMPPLDEGAFLLMPMTMPHASIGEAMDALRTIDMAVQAIPEVETVVGKIGRVESPLDPAPVAMIETVIGYLPEYRTDANGRRIRFRYDEENETFVRDATGEPIPDKRGRYFRQWRDEIRSPRDIWAEIEKAARIPGVTPASPLQPIETRIVMLQSGMRAKMGVKVRGPDLETIERVGLRIEQLLKEVPTVKASSVLADRVVGKPYIEIRIDRRAAARHGIPVRRIQDVIEVAIGGRRITTTVEGRERYPVRVRYLRELRDRIDSIGRILVTGADDVRIPLEQLSEITYVRGPQAIKSEDTFLTSYVTFDGLPDVAPTVVVEAAAASLEKSIAEGDLVLPAGVSYAFAGEYELQVKSERTLLLVIPVALLVIFVILYLQFRSAWTTSFVFVSVFVAWAGGFILIWLYGQPWFLDFEFLGANLRDLLQIHRINLSTAIWVGFIALFGIATDDGVVMATYLRQSFAGRQPKTKADVREATIAAGQRRIRPCLMTSATTLLALLPVLTSTGRGADIMVPMAIPSFGGMAVVLLTLFVVPVLTCMREEWRLVFEVE
jgi:copper/silver efflux system protein